MNSILETLGIENFLYIIIGLICLSFISFIIVIVKLSKLNNKYKKFMIKLGNGKNIEEDLENYMYQVRKVEEQNAKIELSINNLGESMEKCIQKIGIVRYNAFRDTGSDLSFALALLDEKNNGVVLNGIYSREISNIYAKPVKNGVSKYTVSEEEQQAIQQAVESRGIYIK